MSWECRKDSNVKTVLKAFEESHCEQSHCYEALFFLELKQNHYCKPLGKTNYLTSLTPLEYALGVNIHLPYSGFGWQSSLLSYR